MTSGSGWRCAVLFILLNVGLAAAAPADWSLTFNTLPPGTRVKLRLLSTSPLWSKLGMRVEPGRIEVDLGPSPISPAKPLTIEGKKIDAPRLWRALAALEGTVDVALSAPDHVPYVAHVPAEMFAPGVHVWPIGRWHAQMSPQQKQAALLDAAIRLGSPVVQMTMHSDPEGAEVFLLADDGALSRLGTCGEPFPLDLGRLAGRDPVSFQLRLGMYNDKLEAVPRAALSRGTWPDQGAVALQPRWFLISDLSYRVRAHPVVALILLFATGSLVAWVARTRRRGRSHAEEITMLRKLARDVDTSDPLVKAQAELSGYKIIDRLGAGGMATVYVAIPVESIREGKLWAIKVMKPEVSSDPEYRSRFKREAKHSIGLRHPNIVRTVHDGEHDGLLYLVMEYVQGEDLHHHLDGRAMPPLRALKLLRPIFAGVGYAHSLGIVHRDLKPDNVMISDEGQVKVMDFGLARSRSDMTRITQTGTALGTPAYMPPEQLMSKGIDPRSDQYALGVMVFEILTGRLPFEADDVFSVIRMHVEEPPPAARDLVPSLPAGIDQVIAKMMAKQPEDRYATLEEAWEALSARLSAR